MSHLHQEYRNLLCTIAKRDVSSFTRGLRSLEDVGDKMIGAFAVNDRLTSRRMTPGGIYVATEDELIGLHKLERDDELET